MAGRKSYVVEQNSELVFKFISNFRQAHGYPPTFREILEGCNLSSTSVVSHIMDALREQKRVEFVDGKARTITIRG